MNELQQWGIMTDWRHSYFTMMPNYQAMVLRKFGELIRKKMVYRGNRPVFWSIEKQRVLAEDEMVLENEILNCVVLKLPIVKFGKKSREIQKMYPDAKVLVFSNEPWHVAGMQAAGINENILYVLTKWKDEYLIVADKRLSEL
jgi:isoleucyl-tRNA synthetase